MLKGEITMAMRSLKDIREEYNISLQNKKDEIHQEDIAKMVGLKKSDISKLENGHRKPTYKDLLTYSKLFHVSLDYILDNTVKAKKPQNATISRQLGITDAVADTMKSIRDVSSKEYDYSAVLNAFIGNGENTFNFINEIFTYLLSEHVNGRNATIDALMISNILNYLEKYVKPQLTEVLERRRQ
jgi:transcriptional regulator with XRE-family HTH domain